MAACFVNIFSSTNEYLLYVELLFFRTFLSLFNTPANRVTKQNSGAICIFVFASCFAEWRESWSPESSAKQRGNQPFMQFPGQSVQTSTEQDRKADCHDPLPYCSGPESILLVGKGFRSDRVAEGAVTGLSLSLRAPAAGTERDLEPQ